MTQEIEIEVQDVARVKTDLILLQAFFDASPLIENDEDIGKDSGIDTHYMYNDEGAHVGRVFEWFSFNNQFTNCYRLASVPADKLPNQDPNDDIFAGRFVIKEWKETSVVLKAIPNVVKPTVDEEEDVDEYPAV